MATLAPFNQYLFSDRSGKVISVTEIRPSGTTDTIGIPEGVRSANHVRVMCEDPADTAATVSSITQLDHPQGCTVNLTGGTANSKQWVIAFHYGNAAGL